MSPVYESSTLSLLIESGLQCQVSHRRCSSDVATACMCDGTHARPYFRMKRPPAIGAFAAAEHPGACQAPRSQHGITAALILETLVEVSL